jgi:capsular polysaccharide biosynthesis protein
MKRESLGCCELNCGFMFYVCLFLLMAASPVFCTSVKHPDGFTTLSEQVKSGCSVRYLLEESDSKQFVVCLENGTVVHEGGIVTKEGKIFKDTETYREDQHRLLRGQRDISSENPIFFNGNLVVISSPGQENWYHWLFQVLPRIKILIDSGIEYDKIYINNLKFNWQKESLRILMKLFDLSEDRLFLTSGDSIVQASHLIVPSIPFAPSKSPAFPLWLKTFIRNAFLVERDHTNHPERIYISRSKAATRRITNEEALIKVLKQEGFVILNLEELPITQQAELFYHAKVVVGPHGSGFSNLIFSNLRTSVVEIDHGLRGQEQRSFYKRMAKIMDCHYFGYYPDLIEEDFLEEDITINVLDFINFLHETKII